MGQNRFEQRGASRFMSGKRARRGEGGTTMIRRQKYKAEVGSTSSGPYFEVSLTASAVSPHLHKYARSLHARPRIELSD